MSNRSNSRVRVAVALTGLALTATAGVLVGCASVGSTPPYVSDAEKAKAQNPCPAEQGAQKTPGDCKKSGSN
jgi:hypothetical protein